MTEHSGLFTVPPMTGRTIWCGPTAIAAATGVPVERVEQTIVRLRKTSTTRMRRERGKQGAPVKTMYSSEIEPVCRELGFVASMTGDGSERTFKQLTANMQSGKLRGPIIVLVTGHYVALSRWQYVDSNHREPTPHARFNRQRQRIRRVWAITPLTSPHREA